MRFFISLYKWLKGVFFTTVEITEKGGFNYIAVNDLPDELSPNIIFILDEGWQPEALSFKCPCGCNSDIHLNLLKDSRPLWSYNISNDRITISPSVWKKEGCKSHFFIKKGKVLWV